MAINAAPLKVLLVANYEADRQQSMTRFARMLEGGLAASGANVRVVRPRQRLGRLTGTQGSVGKWSAYIDKLILFRPELRRHARWADVVHICDHSNAVYSPSIRGKPVIISCHDMLAIRSAFGEIPENPTRWSGRIYQRMILRGLRRSPYIVCVSEATKKDVTRLANRGEDGILVVNNALNYPYAPMPEAAAERYLRQIGGMLRRRNFLLHVGGNHWYKNRLGVLAIYEELIRRHGFRDLHLVLAGEPCTSEMEDFIEERALRSRVIQVVDPDNEQLRAMYTLAMALLFPSLHEGFGWPIIEANACGCVVFTSNRPPMNEVAGFGATLIDPQNIVDAADTIACAIRAGISGRDTALRNAARFGLPAMIDGYLRVYRSALEKYRGAARSEREVTRRE